MSKDDSREPFRATVSAGVTSDLARAFGVSLASSGYADQAPEPEPQDLIGSGKPVGRGSNRRTRENNDPRFPVHHRAGRAASRR